MKNYKFILGAILGSIIFAGVAFAAPQFSIQRTILPERNTDDIGTSTRPWNNGYFNYLYGDGSNLTGLPSSTSVTPGGNPDEFQYNQSGVFAGTTGLTFDAANGGIVLNNGSNYPNGGYLLRDDTGSTVLVQLGAISNKEGFLQLSADGSPDGFLSSSNSFPSYLGATSLSGLVLNGNTHEMGYSGLTIGSGDSYFAGSLTVNTNLYVNGTFAPNQMSIRTGVGSGTGYISINQVSAGDTQPAIGLGYNGFLTSKISIDASSNLLFDNSSSTDANSGFKFTTKGTGKITLGTLTGILKGTSGELSIATAGTDYIATTTGNWLGTWKGYNTTDFLSSSTVISGTNYFSLTGNNLYPTSTAYLLGIGTTAPSSTLHVVGTSTFSNGSVGINTTPNATPLSVQARTNYALPTTNTRNGVFSVGNTTNAYGIIMGVDDSTGKAWISSQRFSGGAANYPLQINPLGSYLTVGTSTVITTAEGSINMALPTAIVTIKGGANQNTELAGDHLKIGQASGDNGYLYFKSDNSIGASMYWGKTSGAGVSFANTSFIPTSNYGFGLGESSFRWSSFYSKRISDNGTNVGLLDATTPFDVGDGVGLHIKSTSTATILLQGYAGAGFTSYNSQALWYYSATSLARALYTPSNALFTVSNEYVGSDATHVYGNINFDINPAGSSTRSTAMTIKAFNGFVGIGTQIPSFKLHVAGATSTITIDTAFTPTNSTSTCVKGQDAWDTNYLYKCVATNSWVRWASSTTAW